MGLQRSPPEKLRLGVLVSHPIQYFVPVFRKLANNPAVDCTVLYRTRMGLEAYYDAGFGQAVRWDVPLLDGYVHRFLSRKTFLKGMEWSIISALLQKRLDVLLVHGYNSPTNICAIAVAKLTGTKILMRGDTRLQASHRETGFKAKLKRLLFSLCDGFVTIGSLNRDYYLWHGVGEHRLFFSPFCVDNEFFSVSPSFRARCRQSVRGELDLERNCEIVLFSSKLIKRKRASDVICAFELLALQFPRAYLVIAGSGDESANLRNLAAKLIPGRVHFLGFRNQSQLPILYAASDVFVLPSENEPWGLVVNEVMAAGVPVIVSSEIGAAADLVQGHGTGIVFPCGDVGKLAEAMRRVLSDRALRYRMSANAARIIKSWGVSDCALGIVNAAFAVTYKNTKS